jgi:hypothetical protein
MYGYGLILVPSDRCRIIEDAELENHSIYLLHVYDFYDIVESTPSHILTRLSELNDTHLYVRHDFFIDIKKVVESISILVLNYKIKSENIWIRLAYKFQKQEIENKLFELGITSINIVAFDNYLHRTYDQVTTFNIEPKSDFDTLLPKRFSVFSRRYEDWRFQFFCGLIENDLLDKFYYTFTNGFPEGLPYPHEIISKEELKNSDIVNQLNKNKEEVYAWIENMPYCLDLLDQPNSFPLEIYDLYKKSHINIVLESTPYNTAEGILITEKTYKAISMCRPFMIFGTNSSINLLKQLGYEMFEPLIDESYSRIDELSESFVSLKSNTIIKEISRMASMPDTEFFNFTQKLQELAKHNFANFMRLGSNNIMTFNPYPELWHHLL